MGRAHFEEELRQLHTRLIEMGGFVETATLQAVRAFTRYDRALCGRIIEDDQTVNDAEKAVESKCLWLIAREQPIASDLRQITTALKIITDMERIGDHAVDIAELTLRIPVRNRFADSAHIAPMASAAIGMVRRAVTAYVSYDLELARATEAQDDEVDAYFNLIKQELAQIFSTRPSDMDHAIDFLLIAKYLERIADHAVNICEWVHFSQTGEHKNTRIF